MFAADEAEKNPTPDLLLMQTADECEARGDWVGAEKARQEVLVLQERSGNLGLIAKAHLDLSGFWSLLGKSDAARTAALAATAAARRAELDVLISMTLGNEAECALKNDDVSSALTAAAEAVQLIEPGKLYDHMRARALLTRARCLLASGDLAGAERDLDASRELLRARWKSAIAAGPISAEARWWEVNGSLEAKKGHGSTAVESWKQAVEKRRQITQSPFIGGPRAMAALARSLQELADALTRIGDSTGAETVFAEARQIRREIGLDK
jgi:hypothetical protein